MEDDWNFGVWLGSVYFWVAVLAMAGVLVGAFMWASAERSLNDMHTQAVHHSVGYVESHNTELGKLITKYGDIGIQAAQATEAGKPDLVKQYESQRNSVLQDIWRLAQEIDRDEQSERVRGFLNAHPYPGMK